MYLRIRIYSMLLPLNLKRLFFVFAAWNETKKRTMKTYYSHQHAPTHAYWVDEYATVNNLKSTSQIYTHEHQLTVWSNCFHVTIMCVRYGAMHYRSGGSSIHLYTWTWIIRRTFVHTFCNCANFEVHWNWIARRISSQSFHFTDVVLFSFVVQIQLSFFSFAPHSPFHVVAFRLTEKRHFRDKINESKQWISLYFWRV